MADESVPVSYANTPATTAAALPADRAPAHMQETHPTTGPNDPVPQVRHAGDHDDETGNLNVEER